MTVISNPHDRFFKETFSRIESARDFVLYYLPPEVTALLDLESLEATKDAFVGKDLRERFSDLLYRINLRQGRQAYIYLLFEHKSSPEPLIHFTPFALYGKDMGAGAETRGEMAASAHFADCGISWEAEMESGC